MSLRAEQLIQNSKQGRTSARSDSQSSSHKQVVSPEPGKKQEATKEVTPEPPKQRQDVRSENSKKTPQAEQKKGRIEEVKQLVKKEEGMEERQEPEGRQADTTITERDRKEVFTHVSNRIYEVV